jgi:hypothetical protein
MYPPGSKLQIEIADENLWNRVTVSNGRTALGDIVKLHLVNGFAGKEKLILILETLKNLR